MPGEAQQYLIQFLATLHGDKAVAKGLREMTREINKVQQDMGLGKQKAQDFGTALINIGKRALLTIPTWFLLRNTFVLITRTIGDMIRTNVELQDKFARIRTVVSASSKSVEADMIAIKRQIMDVAVTTRRSVLELADAFYFLRTSNLTTEEAMSALIPTVNTMVGTLGNAQQVARAVAGIYNNMKSQLDKTADTSEVFTKIADALTFTYATQDVQMGELIESYTKLAPYTANLQEDFTQLITILGVLNTKMLRSGRTGRLLGQTIIQIAKNSKELAERFNVSLDPDKPISLIAVLEGMNNTIKKGTKLTKEQAGAIQKVFATRGAIAPQLLLPDLEGLIEQIKYADENMEGFAQRMRDIMEATVPAQLERMKNIFAVLFDEFASGVTQSYDLVEALTKFNDSMARSRPEARALGDIIAFIGRNMQFQQEHLLIFTNLLGLNFKEAFQHMKNLANFRFVGLGQFMKEQVEHEQEMQRQREQEKITQEKIDKDNEHGLRVIQREKDVTTRNVALLKAMGANELDIAKYKLEQLELTYALSTEEEHLLEIAKAKDEVLIEELKYRQSIYDILDKAGSQVLKAMGASELQILQYQEEQLMKQKETIGDSEYLLRLTQLRIAQQIALVEQENRQKDTVADIALMYEKADEIERGRIRRMAELRGLTPDELARQVEKNAFDKQIVIEFWNQFSEEQKRAVGEFLRDMYDLEIPEIPEPRLPEIDIQKLIPPDKIAEYWREWEKQGIDATDLVSMHFIENIKTHMEELNIGLKEQEEETPEQRAERINQMIAEQRAESERLLQEVNAKVAELEKQAMLQQVKDNMSKFRVAQMRQENAMAWSPEINPTFGDININLPEGGYDRLVDKAVEKFEQRLRRSDTLKNWIAEWIRPHI